MSTFVFTFHGKLTWMPDHPAGFVRRGEGILPPDADEAERYRRGATCDEFLFTEETQRVLIEEAQRAAHHQKLKLHLVATDPTHVHVLVSWDHDKPWNIVRDSVKSSLTRALRKHFKALGENADRPFFSHGSSRKCISTQEHFDYWMHEYGPKHSGLMWRDETALFHETRESQSQ